MVRVNLVYVSSVSRHIFIRFQCVLTHFKCRRCIKRGHGTFEKEPSFDLILTILHTQRNPSCLVGAPTVRTDI